MQELIIYGASDDLIEIEFVDRLAEEFYLDSDESNILAISDGTVLRVRYDEDGVWRFTTFVVGSSSVDIVPGTDDDRHSDVVTLTGDNLNWVVLGNQLRK